ncbi:basic salivary proline-rich protein 2-like [Lagopus muta]|uniref:basic salivary proline-rich protein 2-like n=1 Tax=Lagopus muta TaxID=64668 RepID=UPI00209CB1E2|nr:basic salivary proline-rich protein 2-like [Lagopus muta]
MAPRRRGGRRPPPPGSGKGVAPPPASGTRLFPTQLHDIEEAAGLGRKHIQTGSDGCHSRQPLTPPGSKGRGRRAGRRPAEGPAVFTRPGTRPAALRARGLRPPPGPSARRQPAPQPGPRGDATPGRPDGGGARGGGSEAPPRWPRRPAAFRGGSSPAPENGSSPPLPSPQRSASRLSTGPAGLSQLRAGPGAAVPAGRGAARSLRAASAFPDAGLTSEGRSRAASFPCPPPAEGRRARRGSRPLPPVDTDGRASRQTQRGLRSNRRPGAPRATPRAPPPPRP